MIGRSEEDKGRVGEIIAQWVADGTLPDDFVFVPMEEGPRWIAVYVKPRTFSKMKEEAEFFGCSVGMIARGSIVRRFGPHELFEFDKDGEIGEIKRGNHRETHSPADDWGERNNWIEIPTYISQEVLNKVRKDAREKGQTVDEWVRRANVQDLYSCYGDGEEVCTDFRCEDDKMFYRSALNSAEKELDELREKFDELEASIARL